MSLIPTDFVAAKESATQNRYFTTLYNLLEPAKYGDTYYSLIHELYCLNFEVHIEKDNNRATDGINLRREYLGDDEVYIGGECSILEMMMGLAKRIDAIMYDPGVGENWVKWFWEMIDNLGLRSQTDENFSSMMVDRTIMRFNCRMYEYDGRGGLFPLRNPSCDQSMTELWYQMQAYLIENY